MSFAHELRSIPQFSDLDEPALAWLADHGRIVELAAGEALFVEGDPASLMFAVLEGEIRGKSENGKPDGRVYVLPPGRISGMLPHSRMTHFPITARAVVATRLAVFPADSFPEMLSRIPVLEARLASVMADRVRQTTELDQFRERLMSLGKLSAGLAHELNNPAAAIQRSVEELKRRVDGLSDICRFLLEQRVGTVSIQDLVDLKDARAPTDANPDPLARSALEDELTAWLRERGIRDPWIAAETFVSAGVGLRQLDGVQSLPDGVQATALAWLEGHLASRQLADEITEAARRISGIVAAVKTYSHMDRAQAKIEVDVSTGLDATLTVMAHKLRDKGLSVTRDYADAGARTIFGNAGELNQVWTNLIDNAIDASPAGGNLSIRITGTAAEVVVEIVDEGSGIPVEIQRRIFDPFFTTKGVGSGTGLGLDVTRRIVTAHHGDVRVESVPGRTCFEVRLPRGRPA